MIRTLDQEWHRYVKAVYDDRIDPHSAQYTECRRAFMAGASAFLGMLNDFAMLPDDQSVLELETLNNELRAFSNKVKRGVH